MGHRREGGILTPHTLLCYNNTLPYNGIKVVGKAQEKKSSISLNFLYKIRLLKITNKKACIKDSLRILSEAMTSIAFLGKNKNLAINHPINF